MPSFMSVISRYALEITGILHAKYVYTSSDSSSAQAEDSWVAGNLQGEPTWGAAAEAEGVVGVESVLSLPSEWC